MNAFDALHQCCDEGKVDVNTFPDARFRQNFAWFVDDTDTALPSWLVLGQTQG